jgi:ferredoxin
MPWVDEKKCVGCGICVEECPVDAISMVSDKAVINMAECIHCGTCHSVCPSGAVGHDSEKIPEEVRTNVEETLKFMKLCETFLGDAGERNKCLGRMIKHFNKSRIVAEKTLEELEKLKNS